LGVSPLLRELGAEVEEAYDLIREIEYAFQRGWDWADDATRVVEHVRKAKRLVSELLPKVGKRRKRLLSNVVAYLGEVERRMQRILDGRGKLRDVGLALDFIRAAWVDVQFALGKLRRGAPVPDGAEDLLVPDVPEREVPEPLVEREAEYEAEFGEGW
jgi:hypothetical protein